MSNQLPLFEPRVLARYDDVDTSHAAAESIKESRARQHRRILRAMKAEDRPITPEEISTIINEDIWRRMSELREAGLIERTDIKRRNQSGRQAYCYVLTAKGSNT